MATLLIVYDLNRVKDYDTLWDEIKSLSNGNWWHHLDSTWIINTPLSVTAVRDRLSLRIDDDDELLVVDVTGGPAAWTGFNAKGSGWLTDHL